MASRWHGLIERFLPWFDSDREKQREARTERTLRRSEIARIRGERVIAEYREAEKRSHRAGEAVIEEVRRDDE